jgi:hypothetical protein
VNIKNYTSTVPVDTTMARIERLLVDAGATGIGKEYAGRVPVSLIFRLPLGPGKPDVAIKLPANVSACVESLWKQYRLTASARSSKTKEDFREQAARTAWKLQQDWLEVQISMIKLQQQDAMQAFLPYAWDGNQTVYERVRDGGFRALLPAPLEQEDKP